MDKETSRDTHTQDTVRQTDRKTDKRKELTNKRAFTLAVPRIPEVRLSAFSTFGSKPRKLMPCPLCELSIKSKLKTHLFRLA